jgi:hypothetical protein
MAIEYDQIFTLTFLALMHPTPYISTQEGIPMAIACKHINTEDDFLKVGPDATVTFGNFPSNLTEHASSENLLAPKVEDDDLEEEDEDVEEEVEEEEEDFDEEDDEEDDEDEIDEDDEEDEEDDDEEEDHDLATGPKAPSVYRRS